METPREFIRRRKVEMSSPRLKRINQVVNIDSEVQRMEEYIDVVKKYSSIHNVSNLFYCYGESDLENCRCKAQCDRCKEDFSDC